MFYVYIGCLTFGVVYSVISALLGGHGFDHSGFDHSGFDHSGVSGHAGTDSADTPSPFSPLVIASAITTFGAVGLIGKAGFKMGDLLSVFVSLGFAGVIGAAIFFGIVKFMYGSQSNSTFSLNDLIGAEAEVITPIPAKGMGEIEFVINGVRYNFTAKSAYAVEIPRGETVRIKDISCNVASVSQKMTIDELDMLEKNETQRDRSRKNNN